MAASKNSGTAEALKKAAEQKGAKKTAEITRDGLIRKYLKVYQRCVKEEPKTFDAKGALNALDQISRILGLDTPIKTADIEGNKVILTLSDEVGDRGD